MFVVWNRSFVVAGLLSMIALSGLVASRAEDKKDEKKAEPKAKRETKLFNGKNLDGWKNSMFGGDGEITVEDGQLILDRGNELTGVTWKDGKTLPKFNYEISLEAQRVEGSDFFCGLTFPIKDDPCSLILGGWGGTVCGISSLDFKDASENETTLFREFKNGQWYKIRLRVLEKRLTAWIDGKEIIDVNLTGKKIGIRSEVDPSKPLGFCSYSTKAALRNIVLKEIEPLKEKPTAADSSK